MDDKELAETFERHRNELRMHCYRLLGAVDEADDLTQETFLLAWKGRASFEGRASVRAWLYGIATNACLDALSGRARRALPDDLDDGAEIVWLQPFPDPADVAVSRETIGLAFVAAIQHLPPRQRAIVVVRDALGWSVKETAALFGTTPAAIDNALRRARAVLRDRLPEPRPPSPQERAILARYLAAVERADVGAVAELLDEEIRTTMPPYLEWFHGRDAVVDALTTTWDPASASYVGRFRGVQIRANGSPAVASYLRGPGDDTFRACAIGIFGIAQDRIVAITAFHDPALFPAFGLPPAL